MKKFLFLFILTLAGVQVSAQQDAFITTWKVDAGESITIPTHPEGYYNYTVDWGELGTIDSTNQTDDASNTYTNAGIYTVTINGDFPRIYFNDEGDKHKIRDIVQWGTNEWTSMKGAFHGCEDLSVTATDIPNLSEISDMSSMFKGTTRLAQISRINDWNVSYVTNMSSMFSGAKQFNSPLDRWRVSRVNDMSNMFDSAENFDNLIFQMLVGSVTNMKEMFQNAKVFNSSTISHWNVMNVTNMEGMFAYALDFNQNIRNWKVGNVTNMKRMFHSATEFDDNIGWWNVSNVTDMTDMFLNAGLSLEYYDTLLNAWNGIPRQDNVSFHGGSSMYCYGEDAKANMMAGTNGWIFQADGGRDPNCAPEDFITTWQVRNTDLTITIPTHPDGGYSYTVDWGDGSVDNTLYTNDASYTYALSEWSSVNYTVTISGTFPRIYFNNEGDRLKIQSIQQWGTGAWTSMEGAFYGCERISIQAPDTPNLSEVENMENMFRDAVGVNIVNSHWNVSNVTNMKGMFRGLSSFGWNIKYWDVSNVTNMSEMFMSNSKISGDFNAWDVSNVEDMSFMFAFTRDFDSEIGGWNVGNVTTMESMFFNVAKFNKNIGAWDVSNVTTMKNMFAYVDIPISWSAERDFDQNIGAWDVSNVTTMEGMFEGTSLSTPNYDALLNGWDSRPRQNNVPFHAGDSQYCYGGDARASMMAGATGWTIQDGELQPGCDPIPFITKWWVFGTDLTIIIPTIGGGYSYTVDWGDGIPDSTIYEGNASHTYTAGANYIVKIYGDFPRIYFNNGGDRMRIAAVEQWGTTEWTSMEGAFYGCERLSINAPDSPDLSEVESMENMFRDASNMNGVNWDWDVSNVTNMKGMFSGLQAFRANINGWDVSSVTNMSEMFMSIGKLNGNFNNWDVSNVEDMSFMFSSIYEFNSDIGSWIVANVTTMESMFSNNSYFNQNIGAWDVSNVNTMKNMFAYVDLTGNQPERVFDQNIGAWNVSNVTTMEGMFEGTALSTPNYDALLNGWNSRPRQNNVPFHAGDSQYCYGEAARANMMAGNIGWTIQDGELEPGCEAGLFITTWEVGASDLSITIPTFLGETYSYTVDWGDGLPNGINQTADATHIYANPGIYTVTISGDFPRIYFNDGADKMKIKSIEQWGTNPWNSMESAFHGCANLMGNATDAPDLSGVTVMSNMFNAAYNFNQDINGWNVSNVTDMSGTFRWASAFNQDLNAWNVSGVTNMEGMFQGAGSFNGNISNFNVSSVTTMEGMFDMTYSFNQNIGSWNVSNVENMDAMFSYSSFNQDIGQWDVSKVNSMKYMFSGSNGFDQNIGRWDVTLVTTMEGMFNMVILSTVNYDALLMGWNALPTLQPNVPFDAGYSKFCAATAARANMLSTYNWSIQDAGQEDCMNPCADSTTYENGEWSNGPPTADMNAWINDNYITATDGGNIEACAIYIQSWKTVTVSPGTSIRAEYNLTIDGTLIFESDEFGDGELGEFGPFGRVGGESLGYSDKATIHRYFKGKRSYRMVSPAVTTSTTINANWQEGQNNTSTDYINNQNLLEGFGTHITGSQTGLFGFDATQTGNSSMFRVNVASQQFEAVGNTNVNTLTAGEGYFMMVRGDRSIDMNTNDPIPSSTILRTTGQLMVGNQPQTFNVQAAEDFVMFGNPYQSAVNVIDVLGVSDNVNANFYYVYDPSLGAQGAYVTVNLPSGNNNNGSTMVVPESEANQYLQPGQGGQVASLAAGQVSINFQESHKTPGNFTSTNAGSNMLADGMLMGQLYTQENYSTGGPIHDGFAILFADENNNALTQKDAVKPMNFDENMGINHDGTYLSIESRAIPAGGENLPLYSVGYQHSEYVLKMELSGLDDVAIYLDDNFTGSSTLLEQGAVTYSFNLDSTNTESRASDRFSIRIGERLSVDDNELFSGLSFYPNPMGSQLYIGNSSKIQLNSASIYDLTGRLILSIDLKGATSEVTLDVSALSTATYMVVINGQDGQVSRLLIKK